MRALKIEALWFHAVFKCPNFRLLSEELFIFIYYYLLFIIFIYFFMGSEELVKLFRPIIINADRSHHPGSTCLNLCNC